MKKFIFDEYHSCINPNRLEIGDKDFFVEIQTACNDGKWYNGYWYWTRGHTFDHRVYLDTYCFESEIEAVRNCAKNLIESFKWDNNQRIHKTIEVPDYIFKELKSLMTPQLKLF